MTTERCGVHNCVRVLAHAGAHTACPSSATLDWDHDRAPLQAEQLEDTVTLFLLDFPAPPWADLND